jgi:hypothetical protein
LKVKRNIVGYVNIISNAKDLWRNGSAGSHQSISGRISRKKDIKAVYYKMLL